MTNKVLIVDEVGGNLLTINTILHEMSLEADGASSGAEAISLASKSIYSLILLMIQANDTRTSALVKELRSTPNLACTPLILISADNQPLVHLDHTIKTGAVDIINLNTSPEEIKSKILPYINWEDCRTRLVTQIEALTAKNRALAEALEKQTQLNRELEIDRNQAIKISEFKSQLLVNVSHEIRTPVNTILGFADLITHPTVSQKDKEKYIRYVSNSSRNLLFLLDEIIDQSRLEAGELNINIAPLDISALCSELLDSFENIRMQEDKDQIMLHLGNTPSTDHFILNTDGQRLRQVLSNLITNALKYTNEGEVVFGFDLKETAVQFYVKDTGIGIAPDDMARIFYRFRRAEADADVPGTGLGLSISKNLVELLGGRIWVESELDKGSTFYFSIPHIPPQKTQQIVAEETGIYTGTYNWNHKTLLIAEDEELNYLFLKESLKSTHIKIIWAKTGREAIDRVMDHPELDLVLMDIRMPDIDGYQATRTIKSMKPSLPLIIQTAFAIPGASHNTIRGFFDDLVTKPINRIYLLQKMAKYLSSPDNTISECLK